MRLNDDDKIMFALVALSSSPAVAPRRQSKSGSYFSINSSAFTLHNTHTHKADAIIFLVPPRAPQKCARRLGALVCPRKLLPLLECPFA